MQLVQVLERVQRDCIFDVVLRRAHIFMHLGGLLIRVLVAQDRFVVLADRLGIVDAPCQLGLGRPRTSAFAEAWGQPRCSLLISASN